MDVSTSSASGSGLDCVPRPAQPHHTPSESQIAEANRRLALVETYRALRVDQGLTPNQAARRMGESRTTLDRYTHAFAAHGYNGLVPAWDKSGRRSTLDKLAAEIGSGAVQEALDAVRGLKLDTESNTTAWRLYAQSDRCPEPLARVVLDPNRSSKHALPPSLRKATRLNEALHDAHRGPRRLALKGMWTPRQLDILPGDVFSADDTTPIWAWWVPWETSKEYPYGVKLLQGQFLPVIDVASQCALCFVL
ncbi:MAG TPA: hypothetical protein VNO52_17150, partial [Methylomirabilota bacterium]|nr:hypothetical protein [Methylomirabilota bacterium]